MIELDYMIVDEERKPIYPKKTYSKSFLSENEMRIWISEQNQHPWLSIKMVEVKQVGTQSE